MICIAQEYRSYIQGFRQIFYIKALHNHKNWIIFDLATIILRCLDHLEFRHQNHRFQCIKTETQDNVVFTASARWRTRIKTNGQRHQLLFRVSIQIHFVSMMFSLSHSFSQKDPTMALRELFQRLRAHSQSHKDHFFSKTELKP